MKQIVEGLDFLRQEGIVAYYEGRFWTAEELENDRKRNDGTKNRRIENREL